MLIQFIAETRDLLILFSDTFRPARYAASTATHRVCSLDWTTGQREFENRHKGHRAF